MATSGHLKYHLTSYHKGEKNYVCDYEGGCGKAYAEPHALKIHIQTVHEGRRDFPCEFCGKAFITKQHLKVHIRNNTCIKGSGLKYEMNTT